MKIRRVVTANDEEGKSFIKWDSLIEGESIGPYFSACQLWATRDLPAEVSEEDPGEWEIGMEIAGGSILRVGRFEPGAGVGGSGHITNTIDYGVVLSGEIWMQLDKEEVHLKAGDIVIQRTTVHNWVNHGLEPCVMMFAMLAQQPTD